MLIRLKQCLHLTRLKNFFWLGANSSSAHSLSLTNIRILRFALGVTLSIAIAFAINWPLSFVMPLFVAKILSSRGPRLSVDLLFKIFLLMFIAFLFADLITQLLLPYPVIFILMVTLILFRLFYWHQSGGNVTVITLLLLGLTIVPMLGQVDPSLAGGFVSMFLISAGLALLISMIFQELLPDCIAFDYSAMLSEEKSKSALQPEADNAQKLRYAIISTSIVMPLYFFFFLFELSSSVLILAFVTLMALQPDLASSKKGSLGLLTGNSMGGIVAILFYQLLVAVPSFTFLILGFLYASLWFANIIFSERPSAPLFIMGFTTVILLISSGTSGEDGAGSDFYQRIIQIALACGYSIMVANLADNLIKLNRKT